MKELSAFLLLIATSVSLAQGTQVQLFPITDVVPEYPTEAIVREQEGWVLLSLDVSATGVVSNIRVRDAEPGQLFDQAALDAALRLQFEPYTENGIARAVSGIQYVFRFELSEIPELEIPEEPLSLNDSASAPRAQRVMQRKPSIVQIANEDLIPLSAVAPDYPTDALEREIGGWVIVRFAVSDQGAVIDPVVEDSEPANVFDRAALDAVRRFSYEARSPEEDAVDRQNVFHLFKFRPAS